MNHYKLVAMIPARMGSKRIPKKNIRYMLDKPLIQYPIDLAKESNAFESIWINTESPALGSAGARMGAQFHQRPPELSSDTATNRDFVYDFLKKHECDYVVMINPTSPALRIDTLKRFIAYLQNNSYDTIMSVMSLQAEGFIRGEKINFDGHDKIPSQLLTPIETVVWAVTAWKRDTFLSLEEKGQCPIFGGNMGRFVISKDEAPDLDTEEDWRIAEAVLTARRNPENSKYRYLDIE